MLDAWRRAGFTRGQTIIDIGSGPGYATIDLAKIVGPTGRVIAVERSARFLTALRAEAAKKSLANIETNEADITAQPVDEGAADGAWCRWVFSWLTEPERAVANIARALKPGATIVFHEYLNYASWRLLPRNQAFEEFVTAIIASVARTGTEMDAATALPTQLAAAGFDVTSLTPIADVVGPTNHVWQWPAAFVRGYHEKLVAEGLITSARAAEVLTLLDQAERNGDMRMATPTVLEIIARRR